MVPRTQYARSGKVNIAYQVIGEGPLDLVFVPGWVSHLELAWEDPERASFLRRLASFSRLIIFDKRGTGLSDRVPDDQLPTRRGKNGRPARRNGCGRLTTGGAVRFLGRREHVDAVRGHVSGTYARRWSRLFSCFAKRVWSPIIRGRQHPSARKGIRTWSSANGARCGTFRA